MGQRPEQLDEIVFPLVSWFREHARDLPWRRDPQPYHVWISEIMLQQTRVAAVLGYYARFLEALPTVEALAQVEEGQLLKLWQGLGYYNRARNLQKAARQIMEEYGGRFPRTYDQLCKLAGVGDYTAGAIASIAFGQPVPAVDGNVLRVIARLTGDPSPIDDPATKQQVRDRLSRVIPLDFPGQFNQALMELGALVCLPNGAPLCDRCPLADRCQAHLQEKTGAIPTKRPKKPRRVEQRQVYLIFCQGRVALRRRPEKGLLAALWELPNTLRGEDITPWGLDIAAAHPAGGGKHIFSHVEWHMEGTRLDLASPGLPPGWVWADRRDLGQIYPVPNAFAPFLPQVEEALAQG